LTPTDAPELIHRIGWSWPSCGRTRDCLPVTVAEHDGEMVRVASGLDEGAAVALNLVQVEDGAPVQAVPAEQPRTGR